MSILFDQPTAGSVHTAQVTGDPPLYTKLLDVSGKLVPLCH